MVRTEPEKPARIAGGVVLVDTEGLATAWHACRCKPLARSDFRTWLAAHEMLARRKPANPGRAPSFSAHELSRLLGIGERRAKASIRRLAAARLIEWQDASITFPPGPGPSAADGPFRDSIGAGRGSVAVPRRLLRWLCEQACPSLIATALGGLLRCVGRRRSGWSSSGRIKCAWVARAFGVDARAVKRARRGLVEAGWLSEEPTPSWTVRRYGARYRVDLGWDGPTLPPDPAAVESTLPPADLDQEPLSGIRDQDPAGGGPTGAWPGGTRGGGPDRARSLPATSTGTFATERPDNQPASKETPRVPEMSTAPAGRAATVAGPPAVSELPPARLADIRPEDLDDTGRLLELHHQAVTKGQASPSEDGRHKFVAAAEHARAVGRSNPCGLFAKLVGRGWWHFATQGDEDAARVRLRRHLHGEPGRGTSPATTAWRSWAGSGLSADALVVRDVRAAMIRAGIYRDPWAAFAARNPGWDRERWDAALAELGLR